jgi:hypothetical protein
MVAARGLLIHSGMFVPGYGQNVPGNVVRRHHHNVVIEVMIG